MTIYPAPRWFREIVREWLDTMFPTANRAIDRDVDELFTRLVRAQPPNLTVVADSREQMK